MRNSILDDDRSKIFTNFRTRFDRFRLDPDGISGQPFSRRDKSLRHVTKLCLVSKLNVHIRSIPFPNHVTRYLVMRHGLTRGDLNLADFVDIRGILLERGDSRNEWKDKKRKK